MADEIRFIGDMQRLEVRAGDRYVLMCANLVDQETASRIEEAFKRFAGDDAKLLVLDPSMKLGVIGPAEPA
jgi:hypothetical protein